MPEQPVLPTDEFGSFYRAHVSNTLGFFARRVFDPEAALDLTAETFAQAYLSRRRFRGSSSAEAEAWLYTIARRQLSRYLRKGVTERKALERLGLSLSRPTDDDLNRVEELADLRRLRPIVGDALAALSDDQRTAVRLRVVEERAYAAIAAELGITEQVARARVSRGLRALSGALKNEIQPAELT